MSGYLPALSRGWRHLVLVEHGGRRPVVRLWKYAFDRVINTDGVQKRALAAALQRLSAASFLPGKEYVDIGGRQLHKANDYSR